MNTILQQINVKNVAIDLFVQFEQLKCVLLLSQVLKALHLEKIQQQEREKERGLSIVKQKS